jgi:hypothetical protein
VKKYIFRGVSFKRGAPIFLYQFIKILVIIAIAMMFLYLKAINGRVHYKYISEAYSLDN